jgi:aminopeptidase N
VRRERLTVDITATAAIAKRDLPGPRPDVILLNDGDLSYTKVRFDEHSWEAITEALAALPEPLSRAVAWNAARDLVRDARLAPRDFLTLVERQLPAETDPFVVQGVLTFARTHIADRFLPPARRPDALAALAATSRALLADGPEETRLTATRGLIDAAVTPGDAAELREWLTRDAIPDGSAIDHELRWRLLLRLTVLGAAGPADIDAELARDPSATGREGAARCRAALPDPDAKAAAWESMFRDDSLSNYLFTATAQGFWHPEQLSLVRDFVPRFWADAAALAIRRGPALAEAIGRAAFPGVAVDPETLAAGRKALTDPALTPASHRMLIDRLDDLDRALRIRNTYA